MAESTRRESLGLLSRSRRLLLHVTRSSFRTDLLWAALVGCGGALAAYLFRLVTLSLLWLLVRHPTTVTQTATELPNWARIVVPVVGGLLAGLVLYVGMHLARGQSAKDYMEAIRIGDGHIRVPHHAGQIHLLASDNRLGRIDRPRGAAGPTGRDGRFDPRSIPGDAATEAAIARGLRRGGGHRLSV